MNSIMNNLPKLFITLLCVLMASSGMLNAQIKVTRIAGKDALDGRSGIVYTLPRTVVIADLCISKSQQIAGPLAEYAAEYLGIDEVITKDAVGYAMESAEIRTITEPDPGQVYLIEKEDKSQGEVWISFDKPGPLMTLEIFEKTLSPEGFSSWNKELFMTAEAGKLFKKYTDSPTREVTDTIVRKLSIDTLVVEQMIFRHSREEYSDREKAQDAADKIRQIEHDKYNLLIGYPETAYSKDALEYMINNLETQKSEYLKLFTGVTVKEMLRFSIPVIPEPDNESQVYKISGFSKTNGMTDAEGQPEIILQLMTTDQDLETAKTGEAISGTGLVYILPRSFKAKITFEAKEFATRRIEVMQLGTTLSLPATFKRIEFNLETGSLQSVVME